jgi:hypothetical protein
MLIQLAEMHLKNKEHREANKSMATLEVIMNKLQIHENISSSAKIEEIANLQTLF